MISPWILHLCIFVNVVLIIISILGNALILIALQRESLPLHPPSKLLLRCLASTDLCVGLITQPCFVIYLISVASKSELKTCEFALGCLHISSSILCGLSQCTATTISVDRFLALLLGLRYRRVVTLGRIRAVLLLSWLLFVSLSMLYFWDTRIFFMANMFFNVLLFTVISTFCYMKIFFTLRCRQAQIKQETAPRQFNGRSRVRELKYKRSVSTAMLVSIVMIACYLPFAIVVAVRVIPPDSSFSPIAEGITVSLVYFNSSINPVIYFWWIREVREAVKATMRRFCFFYS